MVPMPTTAFTTASTKSTSGLELNASIQMANGTGGTGSYNTSTASGVVQNFDHNYSASGVQIIDSSVSHNRNIPNPPTVSSYSQLAQPYDYSLQSLKLWNPTTHNQSSYPPTNVSTNTNIPMQNQQPVHSSTGQMSNATSNQLDYSHYNASINSTITNYKNSINSPQFSNSMNTQQLSNSINTQQLSNSMNTPQLSNSMNTPQLSNSMNTPQLSNSMPRIASAFSYVVVPPTNNKRKNTMPGEKKKKDEASAVKKIVLRVRKVNNPAILNAPATYSYSSSGNSYVPPTSSYIPGGLNVAAASYIGATSSYVPVASHASVASHIPAASPGTSHASVASQYFASLLGSGSQHVHSVPVLPSTSSGLQDQCAVSMTSCLPFPPSTSPTLPPNWNEHLEDTVLSLAPYKLFPVDSSTLEYATLSALMNPTQILEAEQVVNPTLWSRFVNTRRDMLRSKTDDLQLLMKLGLDEADVMRSAHLSMNFSKDAAVAAYPYNDNMALLFHCTRSKTNVENILLQGLDERVGNAGGLLGRGVYFADDPNKSMQYDGCGGIIFIFAVLLGDCLSVDHLPNKNSFVREPEKENLQKRNFNDFNFDSIVARPASYHNEYVVYNRYQCCPLYKIKYKRSQSLANYSTNDIYFQCKNKLPSFSWIPATDQGVLTAMPNPLASTSYWPFYASAVFSQMGVVQKVEEIQEVPVESVASIDDKLAMMSNLGFTDSDLNLETLKKYEYDLDRSVNYLLDQSAAMPSEQWKPRPLAPIGLTTMIDLTDSPDATPNNSIIHIEAVSVPKTFVNNVENAPEDVVLQDIYDWVVGLKSDVTNLEDCTISPLEQKMEDCSICFNEYDTNTAHWTVLECSHKVCISCYKQIETTRTTMTGVTHTFVKCPFCQGITGTEIGTCPNGTMIEEVLPNPCAGYEQYNTISIRYNVPSHGLNRIVYVPHNVEGNEVLQLLRIAWDRRLCFTIGTSVTTGRENMLVWNIHHKTAQQGGVQCYGFPDPTYFQRVKLELKAYGIES